MCLAQHLYAVFSGVMCAARGGTRGMGFAWDSPICIALVSRSQNVGVHVGAAARNDGRYDAHS